MIGIWRAIRLAFAATAMDDTFRDYAHRRIALGLTWFDPRSSSEVLHEEMRVFDIMRGLYG